VCEHLPDERVGAKRRSGVVELGVDLPPWWPFLAEAESQPAPVQLSVGVPDPRLFPVELLARTWRRVVRRSGRHLLTYGEAAGTAQLRGALATMLADVRGVAAQPANVVVTRGSQMALDLVSRVVLRPGETVAIEAFGYRPAWDSFRLAGAHLTTIPIDAEGLDTDALERLVRRTPIRAVYVTPHHQYPTTVTMSAARRLALLSLARRHRFLILEDDYDHEFHYDGRPVLPLAAADDAGVVVSIGTLSKVLAPGVRVGFLVAPPEIARRAARLRAVVDRQGDHPMEATIAELLEEGELQRHVRKVRVLYQARRDLLVGLIRTQFPGVLTVESPSGGISVWARIRSGIEVEAWVRRAAQRGVGVRSAAHYRYDGRETGAFRLVFARFDERELSAALKTLRMSCPLPLPARLESRSKRFRP
jgi:GntR family transcriptional regulator/MocR family aminotransferase